MPKKHTYVELEKRARELEQTESAYKRSQHALQQWMNNYRTIFDSASDAIFIHDLNDGSILDLNKKMLEMFGYTREEGLRLNVDSLSEGVSPYSQVEAMELIQKVSAGKPQIFDWRAKKKNGDLFWVEVNLKTIRLENEKRVLAIVRDIDERKQSEEALGKNQRPLGLILDTIKDGILVGHTDGSFAYTNKRFAEMWRIPPGHINSGQRESLHKIVLEQLKDPEGFLKTLKDAYKSRQELNDVIKFKDGRVFERYSEPLMQNGKVYGRVWSFHDITELKKTEKVLKESEAQKKAILDSSIDSIRLVDQNLRIIWANKIIETQIGKDRNHIVGNFCYNAYTGRTKPCPNCPAEKARISGKIEHTIICEENVKGVEGTSYWADYAVPLKDESGEITNFIQVSRDITQLKKAEEYLRESEARYRALFDFNPIQTVVVDNDGKISMFNFAKERTSGKTPSVGDVMYKDYAYKHELDMHKELMKCIQTGNKKAFSQLKYKNSFLNIQINPFSGGAIITSEDVTERKRLQSLLEQVRKMEAIGTLSGGIAHEFNNILGIILGNAELAMGDIPEYNPAYDFLLEVKNASMRGKEIVRQLLSFSHKSDLKKQAIDIGRVVRESIKFLRASIPSSIAFEENITEDIVSIKGDKTQIHQIMINLCSNAAHSMEETGGILKISLEKQSIFEKRIFSGQQLEPGDYAQLIIEDTGKGIPHREIEKILDPFYTTKPVDKGSGMGLAVVYGIVKGHEGFIEIKSFPNKGTRVFCYFLITDEVPIHSDETFKSPIEGHETILFVDDEPSLVKMGKQLLERLGYRVETTTDPSEVLEKFTENPGKYDLVITDMTMPNMTGDRLINELRKIKKEVKTILCTGYSKRINEEKAAQIGATGYIMKPIDQKKLADTVRKILDKGL